MKFHHLFRRVIALPQDHGSWIFLFSPLLIGLFAGGNFSTGSLALSVSALAAFLIRQPFSIATKAYSGRRPKTDLPAAFFWIIIYCTMLSITLLILIAYGYFFILFLAIPGIAVFLLHLYLVSKGKERGQAGVEILGTGVISLTAPAAYWISLGYYSADGWWLWMLTWLQAAASIIYAYLRLKQRALQEMPILKEKIRLGLRALWYSSFNLFFSLTFSLLDILPSLIFLPYLLQWIETLWGILNPAIGYKPTRIGIRQLVVSSLFTLLFILFWR
jgi:YwiC-like protein